jgi:hypothetical protein
MLGSGAIVLRGGRLHAAAEHTRSRPRRCG